LEALFKKIMPMVIMVHYNSAKLHFGAERLGIQIAKNFQRQFFCRLPA